MHANENPAGMPVPSRVNGSAFASGSEDTNHTRPIQLLMLARLGLTGSTAATIATLAWGVR